MSQLRGTTTCCTAPAFAPTYVYSGKSIPYGRRPLHGALHGISKKNGMSKGVSLPFRIWGITSSHAGGRNCPLLLAKRRYLATSSDSKTRYRVLTSHGCQYLQISTSSAKHNLEFYVYGVTPESAGAEALFAVHLLEACRVDLGLIALGHLDYERILETFSTEKMLFNGTIEPVEVVSSRANGQYIPVIQEMFLRKTPCYLIGRDRLVEMGALGEELLSHPKEVYRLLWQIIQGVLWNSCVGGKSLSPSLEKVLAEEGSEFCVRRIQQYLHEWESTPLASTEPLEAFVEKTFFRKWLWGRNRNEVLLRRRSQQLSFARPPLPENLRRKNTWRVLLVCDKTMDRRMAERLSNDLPRLLLEKPNFERMHQLQDTCSTKFHLCIMIYIIAPVVLGLRLMWKALKYAYIEHVVKGSTVSVSGDDVLSKLSVQGISDFRGQQESVEMSSESGQDRNLEVTERRLFGLKHTVRDRTRD